MRLAATRSSITSSRAGTIAPVNGPPIMGKAGTMSICGPLSAIGYGQGDAAAGIVMRTGEAPARDEETRHIPAHLSQALFRQDGRDRSKQGRDPALDEHSGAVRPGKTPRDDGRVRAVSTGSDVVDAGD